MSDPLFPFRPFALHDDAIRFTPHPVIRVRAYQPDGARVPGDGLTPTDRQILERERVLLGFYRQFLAICPPLEAVKRAFETYEGGLTREQVRAYGAILLDGPVSRLRAIENGVPEDA